MSHSNSSFTCKTPLSTSLHSALFCPSLLSALPSQVASLPPVHAMRRLASEMTYKHLSCQASIPSPFFPFCAFLLLQTSFVLPFPRNFLEVTSSVFECLLAVHLFSTFIGLCLLVCCLIGILKL